MVCGLPLLEEGVSVAFVGKVESWELQVTFFRCLGSDTRVTVQGAFTSGNWTLYGYRVSGRAFGLPLLVPTDESKVFPEPALECKHFQQCVELCCGIGGISIGAQQLGWRTKVFVDHSDLACRTIVSNGSQVLCGKVEDLSVQARVHELLEGERAAILAGFPCQPYSILGSGKGLKDQRGQTLIAILRIAWLTRASSVILECVAEVAQYADTMKVIQHFADVMNFQVQTTILELAEQWPARRRRWWAVMVPKGVTFTSCNWEKDGRFSSIETVLPRWPSWPVAEEENLRWTEAEKCKYDDPDYGQDCRRLELTGVMPTALHSWGNALQACPCGCRKQSFSDDRLRSFGLRGFAIWSEIIHDLRFPHPREVDLNTLPADIVLPDTPRDALCLVGQLAAPTQALWVLSQVQGWIQTSYDGFSATVPAVCIEQFKQRLLLTQPGLPQAQHAAPSPHGLISPVSPASCVELPATAATSSPLGFLSPDPNARSFSQATEEQPQELKAIALPSTQSPSLSFLLPEPRAWASEQEQNGFRLNQQAVALAVQFCSPFGTLSF